MNTNNTQQRTECFAHGDIALIKVIEDLMRRGFLPLTPFTEQHPFDLIAMNTVEKIYHRIQIKYSCINQGRHWLRTGKHYNKGKPSKGYQSDSFDYYAMYLPEKNAVIYVPIALKGKHVRVEPSRGKFYWYADFLNFNQQIPCRKTAKDIGVILSPPKYAPRSRKVNWPSKEELNKLVWEVPTEKIAKNPWGVWQCSG
jgi:hypothetical protein